MDKLILWALLFLGIALLLFSFIRKPLLIKNSLLAFFNQSILFYLFLASLSSKPILSTTLSDFYPSISIRAFYLNMYYFLLFVFTFIKHRFVHHF